MKPSKIGWGVVVTIVGMENKVMTASSGPLQLPLMTCMQLRAVHGGRCE